MRGMQLCILLKHGSTLKLAKLLRDEMLVKISQERLFCLPIYLFILLPFYSFIFLSNLICARLFFIYNCIFSGAVKLFGHRHMP